jgi:methionyl-tRNA formyltransferase
LLLPEWALRSVPQGCLNIHASLLPRWRGAAPIQRAIEAGDPQTGVCIMQMDEGLDTGAVLMRDSLPISEEDTSTSLHDKLADMGSRLIVDTLSALPGLQPQAQPAEGVTYAAKILKEEALIDWQLPAVRLSQRIRAFDPFPGAHTFCAGQVLKIWSALPVPGEVNAAPGTVVQRHADALDVATGQGLLRVRQVQRPGGKRISAAEYLHSQAIPTGTLLGQATH